MPTLPSPIVLDHELGSGTTASVHLGHLRYAYAGLPAGARVALKVQHPDVATDPRAALRFERELAAATAVTHSNLVRVIARGESSRGRWLLMPYVEGEDLRRLSQREGALSFAQLRRIGTGLAQALAALNAAGWRHGDLKPENVRVDEHGKPVLLDLGFATPLDAGSPKESTERAPDADARPGNLAYLSPEQARGEAGAAPSDLFALGVMLFELATTVHPIVGRGLADDSPSDTLEAIAAARPSLPSLHAGRLPPWFDRLLLELCAHDPARRPSAAETERALREGAEGRYWRRRRGSPSSIPHYVTLARSHPALPFLGRRRELERLTSEWRAVAAGAGRALSVVGEAGSGRSRLVFEFAAQLRAEGAAVCFLHARASEGPEAREAEPLVNLIRRWLPLATDRTPGAAVTSQLESLLPHVRAEQLARVLDATRGDPPGSHLAPLLADALARIASATPALIFIDDLEWASRATFEGLSRLVDLLGDLPLLLVLGRRPDVQARHPEALARLDERLDPHGICVPPLSRESTARLIEAVFESRAPRVRLGQVLHQRSTGLPGLLSEILAMALQRGQIAQLPDGDERLSLRIAPEDLPWPHSLGQAVAERYRHLPAYDRSWLRRLSVVGGHLEPGFLARAFTGHGRAEVEAVLVRLVTLGWLSRQAGRYRFARPILRQAIYEAIPSERRAELHARAAAAFAATDGGGIRPAQAWQRAFHLRLAKQHEELLGLVAPLVRSRWGRAHPGRVHSLASWGLESIDTLPADAGRGRLAIQLLIAAADAADRLGWRERQRRWLDRLTEYDMDPRRDPKIAGRVYLLHGRLASSTGEMGLARGLVLNACRLFERAGDVRSESDATRRLAHLQAGAGELESAGQLANRALELAQDARQAALAEITIAGVELLSDKLDAALAATDRALAELRKVEPSRARGPFAFAYLLRGRTFRLLGRTWVALAAVTRALRLARIAGERRLEVEAIARSGQLLLESNRAESAEDRLREALLLAREIEDRRGEALVSLFLGVLLAEAGRAEAAFALDRALRLSRGSGLKRVESLALALIARLRLSAGDVSAAEKPIDQAVELLEQYGAELADRIVIRGTQSLTLSRLGRRSEGRAIARELTGLLRQESGRRSNPLLRQRQRRAMSRLLAGSLSMDGPIFPRADLRSLPAGT